MTKAEKFRALLKHAWDNSQFYRKVYSEAGIESEDLQDIALEELPVMTKSNLMVCFNEAVTDKRLKIEDLHPFIKDDRNPRNLYLGEYITTGSSAGSDIASYVPYTLAEWRYLTTEAASSLLPDTFHNEKPIRSAFYFAREGHWVSSINASLASRQYHDVLYLGIDQPVEEIWARLNTFQPKRLTGYGSSITWIVDWVLSGKLEIAPETVVISGDGLAPFYRDKIQELWGARIYDLYATVEAIFIALRGPGESHFKVFDELVVLEVVDDHFHSVKPGERGRVLVTNLAQKTLPLIRFDLYDYATLGKSNFGAETLTSLDGKSFDNLPIRGNDGDIKQIPAFELAKIQVPGLRRVQFHSHNPEHFEVWYISEGVLDQEIESAVRSFIRSRDGAVNHIGVKRVDYLPSGLGTKFYNVMVPDKNVVELITISLDPIPEQQLDKKYKMGARTMDQSLIEGTIHEAFRRIAKKAGDVLAVEDQEGSLTYSQLDSLSDNIAYRLLEQGFVNSRPIAIYSPHHPLALAIILGVLKAGGFYLPLDVHLPLDRMTQILEEIQPEIMITSEGEFEGKSHFDDFGVEILQVEPFPLKYRKTQAFPNVSTEAPACLLYTSGTTGTPQGVVLSHKAILNRAARYITDYQIGPGDKLSFLQSYAVNSGLRNIFGTLLSGASLCMYDLLEQGMQELPAWVQAKGITHLYLVPSIWRVFLEIKDEASLHVDGFKNLRFIRLGGEAMRLSDWEGFKERMPAHCTLVNGYAATETGTICQYIMDHQTDIPSGNIPVGFPVKGAVVKVLGGDLPDSLVSLGEIGVNADTLAMGLWNPIMKQISPLQEGFCLTGDLGYQSPDGRFFLVGRKDRLVKVHGYRINLAEIETAATALEGVDSATAVLSNDTEDTATITLFYTQEPGFEMAPKQINEALRTKLPRQAVPTHIQPVKEMPRLSGSKVNLYTLSYGRDDTQDLDLPDITYLNETEETLASIWREVLRVDRVKREDDFIDLGGDSIMVFRVQNRIWEHFGVQISVREFFDATQFQTMAEWIVKKKRQS